MCSEGKYIITFSLQGVHEYTWPFHVIPQLTEPFILGIDFITTNNLTFNGGNRTLTYPYGGSDENNNVVVHLDVQRPSVLVLQETPEAGYGLRLNINADLTQEQENELVDLITDFREVIATNLSELGRARGVQHEIHLLPGPPVCARPYRMPFNKRLIAKQKIDDMLKYDIIRPSISPFSSPIVLVPKKNGEWRFCVDYRKLNAQTVKCPYPLPRIDETLDAAAGSMFFSTLDLYSGYWQIEIKDSDRGKTAFTSHLGHFEFNVLPFGLCNSPSTFQKAMNEAIRPALNDYATVYLDDILIFSKSYREHLIHIRNIFEMLLNSNLRVTLDKCEFCKTVIKYLGFLISEAGIQIDPSDVRAILEYQAPRKVNQLRSFLGMASYYRKFVEHFAHKAYPLTTLTRKAIPWSWGQEEENAFQELKQSLIEPPTLRYPDYNADWIIDCDASSVAVGSVLGQVQNVNGVDTEVAIAYDSRALTDAQRKWSVIERETYAVIVALKKYEPYIFGRRILVRTDHKPIETMLNVKDPTGRRGRWALYLQDLDAEIQYRPGKKNQNADFLSRIPLTEEEDDLVATINPSFSFDAAAVNLITTEILEAQQADPACQKIHNSLKRRQLRQRTSSSGYRSRTNESYISNNDPDEVLIEETIIIDPDKDEDDTEASNMDGEDFDDPTDEVPPQFVMLENGLLTTLDRRIYIPDALQGRVLDRYHGHKLAGHPGIKKTLSKIRKYFYWPKMTKCISNFVRRCIICATLKSHGSSKAPLQPVLPENRVWSSIALDIIGPIAPSRSGMNYILTMVEYTTRYVFAVALPDQTAATVARAFIDTIILEHGVPEQLISDNGSNFRSELIEELCKQLDIRQVFTTPYNAPANGVAEAKNKSIVQIMKAYVREDPENWDNLRAH